MSVNSPREKYEPGKPSTHFHVLETITPYIEMELNWDEGGVIFQIIMSFIEPPRYDQYRIEMKSPMYSQDDTVGKVAFSSEDPSLVYLENASSKAAVFSRKSFTSGTHSYTILVNEIGKDIPLSSSKGRAMCAFGVITTEYEHLGDPFIARYVSSSHRGACAWYDKNKVQYRGSAFKKGDVVQVKFNMEDGSIYFYVNGEVYWQAEEKARRAFPPAVKMFVALGNAGDSFTYLGEDLHIDTNEID